MNFMLIIQFNYDLSKILFSLITIRLDLVRANQFLQLYLKHDVDVLPILAKYQLHQMLVMRVGFEFIMVTAIFVVDCYSHFINDFWATMYSYQSNDYLNLSFHSFLLLRILSMPPAMQLVVRRCVASVEVMQPQRINYTTIRLLMKSIVSSWNFIFIYLLVLILIKFNFNIKNTKIYWI